MIRSVTRPVTGMIVAVATISLMGCGGGDESVTPATDQDEAATVAEPAAAGDPDLGKRGFYQAGCELCHALADAGSTTVGGPDLDDSQPSYELVVDRVTNGKGAMNPYRRDLSDREIADIAAYVVSVAGRAAVP